jgi:hypothetical protein
MYRRHQTTVKLYEQISFCAHVRTVYGPYRPQVEEEAVEVVVEVGVVEEVKVLIRP